MTPKLFLGLALILLAATANAEIKLLDPPANSLIHVTTYENTTITQNILITNTGTQTELNIKPTTTLQNTVFSSPEFGLDPDTNKTITATILATQNEKGQIEIGGQAIQITIQIAQNKITTQLLLEKVEENRTLIIVGLMLAIALTFMLTIRKIQ